jgi:hypothetical protein
MGWSSGSYLMGNVIDIIRSNITSASVRTDIYIGLIREFEDMDCDTLRECMGNDRAFDEAMIELYPERMED